MFALIILPGSLTIESKPGGVGLRLYIFVTCPVLININTILSFDTQVPNDEKLGINMFSVHLS